MNLFLICAYSFLFYILLRFLEAKLCKHDHAEPPIVRSRIPFLGHLLGLFRFGISYYKMLRECSDLPILTIQLATQKVYVVNSPTLISQIYRRHNIIDSTPPFLTMIFQKLFAFRSDDLELLFHGSLRQDTKITEHRMLERGMASMTSIYSAIMTSAAKRLESLAAKGPETIFLQDLLRTILSLSTADGIFGANNPLTRSATFLDRFWQFYRGLKGLTMSPFPSLTAPGPRRSRESLVLSFEDLLQSHNNGYSKDTMCGLLRQTADLARRHGRDTGYIARYFFAVYTAFIINTVPVTFWTIAYIIENPTRLATVRNELSAVIKLDPTKSSENGERESSPIVLDAVMVRQKCPTLRSTLEEVLRHVASSMSTMVVNEDIVINGEYLLKKGALVQIAATAVHSDPNIWSQNAAAFDLNRFLQNKDKQIHPSAYRTFGGGSTLCPGRHLARDEILTFTAMFLYTFDIQNIEGPLVLPPRNTTDMLSVMKPVRDIVLALRRRDGIGKVDWYFRN
ncbi:cytochrome P450 [Xylariaceae sp. FL0662B]|nr:cytochrome P450 [Xylariaceae sp. FL0662B]